MQRFLIVAAILLVGMISVACEGSTANISSAQTSKGYQDGKAVDVTSTFAPTDTLHAVVQVANAPDDTKVKAIWTIVDAVEEGGSQVKDTNVGEKEYVTKDIGSTIDFTFVPSQALPIGKYKVDIYLNDKLDRTLEFQVQ